MSGHTQAIERVAGSRDDAGERQSVRIRSRFYGVWLVLRYLFIYAVLVAGSAFFVVPFLWMIRSSLMRPQDIFEVPAIIFPWPIHWENYPDFWNSLPFGRFFVNTTIVTFTATTGLTVSSGLVAFGFARFRFRGRSVLFLLVLATMMLPKHVTLLPTFLLFRSLGWIDTLFPLIVPSLFGSAFSIFLLRQFFLTLPLELDEAARLDGASSFRIFWQITVPLSKPAIAVVGLFAFIGHWNEFLDPLIYLSSMDNFTVAVGLRFFVSQYSGTFWELMMAAATSAVMPIVIVFFFTQRTFIKGIALTGIKG